MSDFTITEVMGQEGFSTPNGEFIAYQVSFEGERGRGTAQHKRKASSPAPSVGEVVDAELVQKNGRTELKRIWKPAGGAPPSGGNGGGARFQRDPKDTAQIVRQHSQHMAILWAATLQKEHGELPRAEGEATADWLKRLIDFFDADVRQVGEQSG